MIKWCVCMPACMCVCLGGSGFQNKNQFLSEMHLLKFWVQIRYRSLCSASSYSGHYKEKNWGENVSLSFLLGNCVHLSKLFTMVLSLSCTFYTNFGDSSLSSLSQWPQRDKMYV